MGIRGGIKTEDKTIIVIFGIGCVSAIECVALLCGINGAYLSAVIGAITSMVGFAFGFKVAESKKNGTTET